MSSSGFDDIYSPETTGIAAGEQALVTARREHEQQIVASRQRVATELAKIAQQKQEVEAASARVRDEEAHNWLEVRRVRAEKLEAENEAAIIRRDKEFIEKRDKQLRLQEDQRRINRTSSQVFIEDFFANISPRAVLEHLTHTSPKLRKHAMDNISACIGGSSKESWHPTFVRFAPQDIAPDLIPKLLQLLSTSQKPLDTVVKFAEELVSAPSVAKALALSGQCARLADALIEHNEFASQLAVCSFRRMVGMEPYVVKPAYEALSRVIPYIPVPELGQSSEHPAIKFVEEVAPKIIEDCFNNGLWSAVRPLVSHRVTSIRKIVLHDIVLFVQHSDRNQHGIVEAQLLAFLDPYYQSPSPPPDIITFFVDILPFVTEKLWRRPTEIQWLLTRLSDPSPRINNAVIAAFQMVIVKQDPSILQLFVSADMLKKLDEPPTQQSSSITKLICQLLPVLAIPYARANSTEGIVAFLDHAEDTVADAGLQACVRIVRSTIEDRSNLFTVISRLNFTKASTLKLYDHAMPVFCQDWVASGDLRMIVEFIQHSEERIRLPAQKVWSDIVCNSPSARSKIIHDGLLDVIFELCTSQYDDAVFVGAKCCSPMAIEITKSGVNSTRQLVELLNHPLLLLRQAALCAIQVAAESSDASCKVLLEAEAFKGLHILFETYPKDPLMNANKILKCLAPFLNLSSEACTGLLQLLESSSPTVEQAARLALTTISNTNLDGRQILRTVVIDRLQLPTEALIEYSVKAIRDWIGPDLAQLNDFIALFNLVLHSDRRIQTATLISLRQKLSNSDHQESMEKANVIFMIRTLTDSDNPEALNFVMTALQTLALSLARNGHSSTIISLLRHNQPKVREGASAALDTIANGTGPERKQLLEENIIERLIGHEERLDQTQLHILSSIIPKLAIDYLNAGKTELILTLVDHQQQQIRNAATKSVAIIAGGTLEQRVCLRAALLPRLAQASTLLREVAATCLSRGLAHDLVVDDDFTQLFRIFQIEDVRVREPIITELRAHIQGSDEAARRRLVDAGILSAILQAYDASKDANLLSFVSTCVLPMLGPSFTQINGGSTLFPLLTHGDPRIRNAAIQALRNAIDSRHGNIENMAKHCVVEILHPLTVTDDAVRDLWCRILPITAPFLANRAEIDILFVSLNDSRQNVRKAASDALATMAKTSEVTRVHMFPALLHHLEHPSPQALPLIAQAISLSGSTFVSTNQENELLGLILNGGPDIDVAAIEATTQLLTKGSPYEHEKLFNAKVFSVALELHDRRSQRQHSLKLLHAIVSHLSHKILADDELAGKMFSLFDDPGLSTVLYQTWSRDPTIFKSDVGLLPLLFDKLHNPSVIALLRQIVPHMVHTLALQRRLDIIVKGLKVSDVNVAQVFLQATCEIIKDSRDREKDYFVMEPSFVSAIGRHLKGRDVAMRRDSSTIIEFISKGSASRSGRIMDEGIGQNLSWVALNGEKGAQQSSLDALYSLFVAAPEHADRLVADSLPTLCKILEHEDQFLGVYVRALCLLCEIVRQFPHAAVIESRIVVGLVRWLSPRHSITDAECRKYVFDICWFIAQKSDVGREALIHAKVLPELSSLTNSDVAIEVVSACKILKALAHSGTFRDAIISAGLKREMERITSPFRKSTLQSKEEKQLAQAAAKEVLDTFKLSKRNSVRSSIAQTNTASQMQHRSLSTESLSTQNASTRRRVASENDVYEMELRPRQSMAQLSRGSSEHDASPEVNGAEDDRLSEPAVIRLHSRSLSEGDRATSFRTEGVVRLPVVREDQAATIEEEYLGSSTPRLHQVTTNTLDTRRSIVEDRLPPAAWEEIHPNRQSMPPAYKSVSGTLRRRPVDYDDP